MKTIDEIIREAEAMTPGSQLTKDDRDALRILMWQAQLAMRERAARALNAVSATTPEGTQVREWCQFAIRELKPK